MDGEMSMVSDGLWNLPKRMQRRVYIELTGNIYSEMK